jgi:hypothetical protein
MLRLLDFLLKRLSGAKYKYLVGKEVITWMGDVVPKDCGEAIPEIFAA